MSTGELHVVATRQNAVGNLEWTSIPSKGSVNTPSHFMLRKTGLAFRSVGQLTDCDVMIEYLSTISVLFFVEGA